jgi:zinc transporter ZupT
MEIIALILAVLLGIILVVLIRPKASIVALLLTFSGAYLLSITVLKLLPEVYINSQSTTIGIYIILGLLLQLILDYFSKGAEHGHIHSLETKIFPWALFISLNVHAFMEGLPLADHHHQELLWAIVIHKVPIAMVLASLFIFHGSKKIYAIIFLLIFAMMTPLATILGDSILFLSKYSNEINAVVAGTFLHIATIILFESSKEHRFNLYKFIALLLGIFLAIAA